MSVGLFNDKTNPPSEAQVLEAVGPKVHLWKQLLQVLRSQYRVIEDFKYLYGKRYGWALRFRVKSQLLVSLFPTQGGFVAQVNLGPEDIEQALALNPSDNIQKAIERANPYPEGRWLFISIETEEDLRDVQRLVEMRARSKRLV
ncbi:MAG: hypothetical protein BWY63_00840 [Chloroflexi bacterium ADurb.Bin360]|nr:MAG: hypothetical protein BWY63_00840 [Chloroflexi bacterium ADurb.Bin360]